MTAPTHRLEILSRHLTACGEREAPIARNDTDGKESETRPAPGGGRGTLNVLDSRSGKKYTASASAGQGGALHGIHLSHAQLEISEGGTLNAQALKQIKAGGDGAGLRTYDPGWVAAKHRMP